MVALGADHAGFELKEKIKHYFNDKEISYKDFGPDSEQSCDYPEIAIELSQSVSCGEYQKGILVCGTGIGMCIAANKVKGIRAALCYNPSLARMSRTHNDANIMCLGARETSFETAVLIIKEFLNTSFEGGRHRRRIDLIEKFEKDN